MMQEKEFIASNIGVNSSGHLTFAGRDTVDLAREYKTPLYLLDEQRIRERCREYISAFRECLPEGSLPLYASKANSFKQIYRIMAEEGMGTDVVSTGEIYTARASGFDLSRAYFHSNNKTDEDISFAMDCGVGYFVAESIEEVRAIDKEAASRGIKQKLILRLTPGIDPHTYEAISTGKVDSKFGIPIETGDADIVIPQILELEHIDLSGFHCHVGSMVFEEDVYRRTVIVMLEYIASVRERFGYETEILNLGGGFGTRYIASDGYINITDKIREIAEELDSCCRRLGINCPKIAMEPGRSIVADAGMTLYTAGSVKRIEGYKNYVSIDGGMTDNPRYALYKASYTCLNASKINEDCSFVCDLVGRCCESGDIIQPKIKLPESTTRGDIIAVCTTGAYNYSMASNYNRICRPPIVMLPESGEPYVAVKREGLEDLIRLDI